MKKFDFLKTKIEDLYIVEATIYDDERGYFFESYNHDYFFSHGLDMVFVQDNESYSRKNVIRGLHYQHKNPQGKLVRVVRGEVYDVAVDLRKNSATFGLWEGVILSATNKRQLYIPEGFAHGFLVLSEGAEFVYKCSRPYDPLDQFGIIYNDSNLNIDWKRMSGDPFILSEKDLKLPDMITAAEAKRLF